MENITRVYLEMLKNPRCGYGKHMNPCMDCHSLMFRLAGEIMAKEDFHFLFSGEVAGQRPMSQTKQSLRYVEKHSGHDGYILRPLSARALPETIPEKEGWVRRDVLLDISGRSRKPQMALAESFGITDYPSPAGGCLLTDKGYSVRLRELFAHMDDPSETDLVLLKFGRHFRLDDKIKCVVGRTKAENERIRTCYRPEHDTLIKAKGIPGPLALIPGAADADALHTAASICIGYGKAPKGQPAKVTVATPDGSTELTVVGIPPKEAKQFMIV